MNKVITSLIFCILLIGAISATEQSLGTFKQNECVKLVQLCSNCTYNNISEVIAPNSDTVISSIEMTKIDTIYNYTICTTSQIGQYIVNGYGDLDGTKTVWTYSFYITPSGSDNTLGFWFLILGAIILVIILGFSIKDGWFVVIGGMMLLFLGIHSINTGIAGFRDMTLTWMISIFMIGIGAYLTINSAIELIENIDLS